MDHRRAKSSSRRSKEIDLLTDKAACSRFRANHLAGDGDPCDARDQSAITDGLKRVADSIPDCAAILCSCDEITECPVSSYFHRSNACIRIVSPAVEVKPSQEVRVSHAASHGDAIDCKIAAAHGNHFGIDRTDHHAIEFVAQDVLADKQRIEMFSRKNDSPALNGARAVVCPCNQGSTMRTRDARPPYAERRRLSLAGSWAESTVCCEKLGSKKLGNHNL